MVNRVGFAGFSGDSSATVYHCSTLQSHDVLTRLEDGERGLSRRHGH
jgi:hypothetical protein